MAALSLTAGALFAGTHTVVLTSLMNDYSSEYAYGFGYEDEGTMLSEGEEKDIGEDALRNTGSVNLKVLVSGTGASAFNTDQVSIAITDTGFVSGTKTIPTTFATDGTAWGYTGDTAGIGTSSASSAFDSAADSISVYLASYGDLDDEEAFGFLVSWEAADATTYPSGLYKDTVTMTVTPLDS